MYTETIVAGVTLAGALVLIVAQQVELIKLNKVIGGIAHGTLEIKAEGKDIFIKTKGDK